MNTLEQRKGVSTNVFEIGEKELKIKQKKLGSYNEVVVPFEEITKNISVTRYSKKSWLYAAIIFFILAVVVIIDNIVSVDGEFEAIILYGIICIGCFLKYSSTFKNNRLLMCTDAMAIVFFNDVPTKVILDNFIDEILNARNDYLKTKYTKIDYDFPAEEHLYRLRWLNEQEIITDQEFNDYKGRILAGKSSDVRSIGFNN